MKIVTSAVLGLSLLALSAGGVFAQDAAMKSDSMAHMSKSQMKMMDKCKAMDHDMMMKNKSCMAMMKKHPDMMNK